MLHLILHTFRLTLAFIALIISPLLLGRAQPPDPRLTALHLTDCAPPCWIGITLDHTTWGEVESLFSQAYPDHESFLIIANDAGGGVELRTFQNVLDPFTTVSQIFISEYTASGRMIHDSRLMPRLGDILLLWGAPTCILAETLTAWVIRYPTGPESPIVVDILLRGTRLSPHQPVNYLTFHSVAPRTNNVCPKPRPRWHGFAHLP